MSIFNRGERPSQSGQGLVEYSLILVLVALIVILLLITTGGQVHDLFSNVTRSLCQPGTVC